MKSAESAGACLQSARGVPRGLDGHLQVTAYADRAREVDLAACSVCVECGVDREAHIQEPGLAKLNGQSRDVANLVDDGHGVDQLWAH